MTSPRLPCWILRSSCLGRSEILYIYLFIKYKYIYLYLFNYGLFVVVGFDSHYMISTFQSEDYTRQVQPVNIPKISRMLESKVSESLKFFSFFF